MWHSSLILKSPKYLEDFVSNLKSLGYYVHYEVVNCPDYGIPQNRKRLILLVSKFGEIKLIPKTHNRDSYVTVKDAIENYLSLRTEKRHK